MKYLSVCSGIEAATVAWHPLGWEPAAFSEIEPFPGRVLSHHYPTVPNMGDMTKYKEWNLDPIDLLVEGTPCQSFSVAGLRKGLADPRGNLALVYCGILDHFRPRWFVWENVPGVLSSNGGRDFGSFLGAVAELGYGFAYRILDAQWFGVAQRRRRVFVVGHLGDWRPAAEILFEREGLRGNPPPSRKKGKETTEIAGTLAANGGGVTRPAGNANELDFCVVAKCLTTGVGQRYDPETESLIVHGTQDPCVSDIAFAQGCNNGAENVLVQPMHDPNPTLDASYSKGTGEKSGVERNVVAQTMPINTMIAMRHNALGERTGFGIGEEGDPSFTITKAHSHAVAHATHEVAGTMTSRSSSGGFSNSIDHAASGYMAVQQMAVRRLTPKECERLQGFPDDYTNIPGAADGPRYKALGNSMAVPVMHWIGKRIDEYVKTVSTEGP